MSFWSALTGTARRQTVVLLGFDKGSSRIFFEHCGISNVSLQSALTWAACMQRVVLLSFDKDTGRISFRHYGISAAPSGVTRSVKQLVNRRQLPNMGALGDVSELLTKSGYGSVRTSLPSHWHCHPQ